MGRLVTADEVAAAIAYLASPLAASVTGTSLAVDGGFSGLRSGRAVSWVAGARLRTARRDWAARA